MATQIAYQHPLDINKRVAIGVSIPFNGPAVFNSVYFTDEQVKSNIINFILTNKGEKLYQPNYGADLRKAIFEDITENTLKTLEIKIANDIQSNFPNVEIKSLTFSQPSYQDYAIQLNLIYSFFSNTPQNIQIIL
jgi:phage baseplate assembly protein W